MQGSISKISFQDIYRKIHERRLSGVLELVNSSDQRFCYFEKGVLRFACATQEDQKLGSFLVRQGVLDQTTIDLALAVVHESQQRLGVVLLEREYLTPGQLRTYLMLHILDVIYPVFQWDEGSWRFLPGEPEIANDLKLQIAMELIILEGVRQIESNQLILRGIGDFNRRVVSASDQRLLQYVPWLKPIEHELLCDFSQPRSILEVVLEYSDSAKAVARSIYGLLCAGLLKREAETPQGAVPFQTMTEMFDLHSEAAPGTDLPDPSHRIAVSDGPVKTFSVPAAYLEKTFERVFQPELNIAFSVPANHLVFEDAAYYDCRPYLLSPTTDEETRRWCGRLANYFENLESPEEAAEVLNKLLRTEPPFAIVPPKLVSLVAGFVWERAFGYSRLPDQILMQVYHKIEQAVRSHVLEQFQPNLFYYRFFACLLKCFSIEINLAFTEKVSVYLRPVSEGTHVTAEMKSIGPQDVESVFNSTTISNHTAEMKSIGSRD